MLFLGHRNDAVLKPGSQDQLLTLMGILTSLESEWVDEILHGWVAHKTRVLTLCAGDAVPQLARLAG